MAPSAPSARAADRHDGAADRALDEDETSSSDGDVGVSESALGRHMGTWDVAGILFGRMIGPGIFASPGYILRSVGSPGAALILWAVGAVFALSGLMVWLELGAIMPRSGGEKVYLQEIYSRPRLLTVNVYAAHAIILGLSVFLRDIDLTRTARQLAASCPPRTCSSSSTASTSRPTDGRRGSSP